MRELASFGRHCVTVLELRDRGEALSAEPPRRSQLGFVQ
jgi:hypothetical protein